MPLPIITILGKSGAGKTTLIEKLVAGLKARGMKVAAIKHHSHAGFDIDFPGKDSWRFAQAGADQVIIASPDKLASYKNLDRELNLEEILPTISAVDVILAEGYRRAGLPAIEVVRSEIDRQLIAAPEQLIAIVSDIRFDLSLPQFSPDDDRAIFEFILQYLSENARYAS